MAAVEPNVRLRVLHQHLANLIDTRQRWAHDFHQRAAGSATSITIEANNALARLCEKDVDEIEWAVQQLADLIGEMDNAQGA